MNEYPTPHIAASPADFAETVLMPGDPLRSKYIAEKYLEDAVLVNNVRGVQGYTGFYKGKRVSVMASGMGMPSMGIYSHELFNVFGVKNIIRVGSAGAYSDKVGLRDIVLAEGACTDSSFMATFSLPGSFAPIADFGLLMTAWDKAKKENVPCAVGNVFSTDVFYTDDKDEPVEKRVWSLWRKMGVLAVDMEAAALYAEAARSGRSALTILTVSDHFVTGEALSSEERQLGFDNMIKIALETALEY